MEKEGGLPWKQTICVVLGGLLAWTREDDRCRSNSECDAKASRENDDNRKPEERVDSVNEALFLNCLGRFETTERRGCDRGKR